MMPVLSSDAKVGGHGFKGHKLQVAEEPFACLL